MKCDDCLNLLAEYIDGEVVEQEAEQISAHLMVCAGCSDELQALTTEQEIFARYDRELQISPAMWNAIQSRMKIENRPADSSLKFSLRAWLAGLFAAPRLGFAFSGAMAVLIAAVVIGVMYSRMQQQPPATTNVTAEVKVPGVPPPPIYSQLPKGGENGSVAVIPPHTPLKTRANVGMIKASARKTDQNDVLFSDIAYSEIENKDTADHIAQAENLLRSIRSIHLTDDDKEIDVTYEKAMSRRLLDENVVLRRDAEASGKFPVKSLLGDLEPFLIEIANLPDKTTPTELRAIKDRVQKTEIVAALQSY